MYSEMSRSNALTASVLHGRISDLRQGRRAEYAAPDLRTSEYSFGYQDACTVCLPIRLVGSPLLEDF